MKTLFKTALAALVLTAGATAAIPASAQSFGLGFGPRGGISFSYDSGGYCDSYGCPDDFWDLPVYYGPVFWHGAWYDGPVYYRSFFGHRQYWIAGDWRNDEWRGPHPGWWREGRYGPALGTDFYRSHGFHGRWDRGGDRGYGGRDNGPGPGGRDFNRGGDDRRGFDPRDDRGGGNFDRRDDRGGAMDQRGQQPQRQQGPGPQQPPQQQPNRGPQPQAAPQQDAPPPGYQPRADGRGNGHYNTRPGQAAAPAPAAPAQAAPAAAPAAPAAPAAAPPAGGDHPHRDRDDH